MAQNSVRLNVSDNGSEMNKDLAAQLFKRPLASDNGLGIGLYQAYKQANLAGYELKLSANEPGNVKFALEHKG